MKRLIGILGVVLIVGACQESETLTEFTGNEVVYALQQSSTFNVSGTATVREKKDGNSLIIVELVGTDGDIKLPVHLHLGDISQKGAEVAALLNPVEGRTGKSETLLTQLADETVLPYQALVRLEASIKVHLSDTGPERDIVLAAGNVGALASSNSAGRMGIGLCKSED